MSHKKKALLDMDGVVVDFVRGVLKWYGSDVSYGDITWNLEKTVAPTLEPSVFWDNLGYDFWVNLPFTPKGQLLTQYVLQMFGEENVCICTSPCRTPGSIEGKIEWIRRHIPQLQRRFMVTPVKEFAASKNRFLLDDNNENCKKFNEAGGVSILIPQPWNDRNERIDADFNFNIAEIAQELHDKVKL